MCDLSIIVPIFNTAAYLDRCILSCLAQVEPSFTLEIILVNDGSTDDSRTKIEELANVFPIIRTIHQKNIGPGGARNAGLRIARGKYIWFVDSDDQLVKNKAQYLVYRAEEHQVDVVAFKVENQNPKFGPIPEWNYTLGLNSTRDILINRRYFISMCSHLFRRDWLLTNRILVPELSRFEDNLFLLKCFLTDGKVLSVDQVCYHIHPRSNSNSRNKDASIALSMFESIEEINKLSCRFLNKPMVYQALIDHMAGDIGLLLFKARKSMTIFSTACKKIRKSSEFTKILSKSTKLHHRSITPLSRFPWVLRILVLTWHHKRND